MATGIETLNPATGEIIAHYNFSQDHEIEAKLALADQAFKTWRKTPVAQRAKLLIALSNALRANKDKLAHMITLEMGKVIVEAEAEIEKCAAMMVWFAEHGPAMLQDERAPTSEVHSYVSFQPLGAVLAIMPWNFPFWQCVRFAIPTLLAGNVVVLKHSSNVIGCALLFESMTKEAEFPEGVFQNIIIHPDKVPFIIADKRIVGASVTGSRRAGASVAAAAGKYLKKSVLELGGADPFIVLEDADLDAAVAAGIKSRFTNAGQVCIAAKRFILVDKIADEFEHQFVKVAEQLTVGDPFDRATKVGPIARSDLRDNLDDQLQESLKKGAKLLLGGSKKAGPGFFYAPTVCSNVKPDMPIFDDETFGPLAAIIRVKDADEAIKLANQSDYGLNSNLWTRDIEKARVLARQIEAGGVFINSMSASDPRIPIGGIKTSGYGRELSHFGIHEFVNIQTVWIGKSI